MKTILVLTGRNGVGKDFIKDVIRNEIENTKTYAFGDAVKDICIKLFPWIPRNYFYDNELKDKVFIHKNNFLEKTPRQIIHHISSSLQHVDPNIFTDETMNSLDLSCDLIVISDMRIQREFESLRLLRNAERRVVFVKVLDGNEKGTLPKDMFEAWVDAFDGLSLEFVNTKQGTYAIKEFFIKNLINK